LKNKSDFEPDPALEPITAVSSGPVQRQNWNASHWFVSQRKPSSKNTIESSLKKKFMRGPEISGARFCS
jgi:hypothetical protein